MFTLGLSLHTHTACAADRVREITFSGRPEYKTLDTTTIAAATDPFGGSSRESSTTSLILRAGKGMVTLTWSASHIAEAV